MVLLKNTRNVLPLRSSAIRTIAVIGPDAWPAAQGGGSSNVTAFRATSFVEGISTFLGSRARVLYARGLPTALEIMKRTPFETPRGESGVLMERFDNTEFRGAPVSVSRVRAMDQYRTDLNLPYAEHGTGVRWTARYTPKRTGPYLLVVGAGDTDGYTVFVDERKQLDQGIVETQGPRSTVLNLVAGHPIVVRMDYIQLTDQIQGGLGIVPLDEIVSDDAKRIAAHADAAVVCVGFDQDTEAEGFDRTFSLPGGQDALVQAIAARNRRTIVTVTAGSAVDMRAWIDRVPAVLHTWYPGQEGGTALAELLFGVWNPEGKLPMTFDRAWEDNPAHDHYVPVMNSATTIPHVNYAEGMFTGYRYYTSAHTLPAFPFGFGLSYTTFAFSNLSVSRRVSASQGVDVSFDVTNTGTRTGAEVAQLYVGNPSASIPRPEKELKGFAKVRLNPGDRSHITLHLAQRAFSYFDVRTQRWHVDRGTFAIYVGNSSEDTPLTQTMVVDP